MFNEFDKIYSETPQLYGNEPSDWVRKILEYRKAPALVLDIGICYGRNALFLAKNGYTIEGVDISQVAIDKCLKEANKNNLDIRCYCENINDFIFNKKYDIIFSTATLQYLGNKEKVFSVIEKMKKNTMVGGLNIISAPTDTKIGMDFPYYFNKKELKNFYNNWDILEFNEEEDLFSTGKIGTIAFIIAKKR
ncbi:MAG: methyltransferase domain-containing protein [Nanoarchaeota archaeon]|jgi:tellurite methyltransferase|nr:methyltransferase domain-containing protein [Nanoarchaeota archaeon]